METRVCGQPSADLRGLVGAVTVAHQVDVEVLGGLLVDLDQELLELNRTVPTVQRRDHGAVGNIEGREQTRGAMARANRFQVRSQSASAKFPPASAVPAIGTAARIGDVDDGRASPSVRVTL